MNCSSYAKNCGQITRQKLDDGYPKHLVLMKVLREIYPNIRSNVFMLCGLENILNKAKVLHIVLVF